jgi:hypothetical protein
MQEIEARTGESPITLQGGDPICRIVRLELVNHRTDAANGRRG